MSAADLFREFDEALATLAGRGPISDGVPEFIGRGGNSEHRMPPPPPVSRPVFDSDKTAHVRKPL